MPRNPTFDLSNIEYVFLDRDGVINRRPPLGQYITRCNDLVLLPGVAQAIARLNRSKRRVIIVTNQRGVALGLYSSQDVDHMHHKLQIQLAEQGAHIDAVYVCPHDAGQCSCRKPLTGLFDKAFSDFPSARASHSLMAGDSLRDIQAGIRAGMLTALILGDHEPSKEDLAASELAHLTAESLPELVDAYFCASGS